MNPRGLLSVARVEATHEDEYTDVSDEHLRRALGTNYYALLHFICNSAADLYVGEDEQSRRKPAWRHIYRGVNHGTVLAGCRDKEFVRMFPYAFQFFAETYLSAHESRISVEYDPFGTIELSLVLKMISETETALEGFERSDRDDRKAFLARLMFPKRP